MPFRIFNQKILFEPPLPKPIPVNGFITFNTNDEELTSDLLNIDQQTDIGLRIYNTETDSATLIDPTRVLAGAGGTVAFTGYGIYVSTYITSAGTADGEYGVGHELDRLFDNNINAEGCIVENNNNFNNFPVSFACDFNVPQIVTRYRIWPRATSSQNDIEAPSSWELRASATKELYDAGTYTVLDSRSGLVATDWNQNIIFNGSGTELASNNLDKANEYNFTNVNPYKFYVLYIDAVCGSTIRLSLGEFGLYGY